MKYQNPGDLYRIVYLAYGSGNFVTHQRMVEAGK